MAETGAASAMPRARSPAFPPTPASPPRPKPSRRTTLGDLPDDALELILLAAGFGTAAGTRDRVRCATLSRSWARVLARPSFWTEVELNTTDFDCAGGPRALAATLLALAGRGRVARVRLVAAPPRSGGSANAAHGSRRPAAPLAPRLLPRSASEALLDPDGGGVGVGAVAAAAAVPRRLAAAHASRPSSSLRRPATPPAREVYGEEIRLEPFPGARDGFSGHARELEATLAAAWEQRPPPPASWAAACARIEAALRCAPFGRRRPRSARSRGVRGLARAVGARVADGALPLLAAALAVRLVVAAVVVPLLLVGGGAGLICFG